MKREIMWMLIIFMVMGACLTALAQEISIPQVVEAQSVAQVVPSVEPPPVWLIQAMHTVESLPIVGKPAVELFKWLGVLAAIATALVTFLISVTRTLYYAGRLTKVYPLMLYVTKFESGKVMYWLKYFSIYNAEKSKDA